MLHFDLNLSLTLRDLPPLARFDAAARHGFGAVEFWWPSDIALAAIRRSVRDNGLAVALINFDGGDLAAGERGFLNDPRRQVAFRAHVPVAIELAHSLGCRRLNALAGRWLPEPARDEQLALVRENLRWAAERAAAAGITIVVEALNDLESPGYLFTTTASTLAMLDSVGADNLAYQYDVYHMQRMEGEPERTIAATAGRIGHLQVADVPGRGQPGTGELNFRAIFAAIAASDYAGSIGLEYIPQGSLEASFAWLPAERRGPIALEALKLP